MWHNQSKSITHSSKRNDIIKFVGKCMELEKIQGRWGIPDPEIQMWYVYAYLWTLDLNSMVTKLQYVEGRE